MTKIVDIRPELQTVAIRPTKDNPDIKVVIGNDNGNYIPKQIIYPDSFSDDEIHQKISRFQSTDSGCKVCNRYSAKCNRYNALIEVTSPVQVAIVLSIAGAGAYFFVKYLNSSDKERKQRKPTHPKVGITIIKEKKLKKKSKKEPEPGIPVGKPVED